MHTLDLQDVQGVGVQCCDRRSPASTTAPAMAHRPSRTGHAYRLYAACRGSSELATHADAPPVSAKAVAEVLGAACHKRRNADIKWANALACTDAALHTHADVVRCTTQLQEGQ